MSRWFRWYEGTSEDGKFRVVARMSRVTIRDALALWAFMLEDAAHLDHRGICVRDEDFMSSILDFEDGVVENILAAMENVGMVSIGHGAITICNWGKRQFEGDHDPTAAERQRRKRERDKSDTQNSHTHVTRDSRPPETETYTETDKKKDIRAVAKATRTLPADFDKFWEAYPSRGKARNPKHPARQKFDAAVKSGLDPLEIIEAAKRYREAMRESGKLNTEFVAMASTWLNQRSWDDYRPPPDNVVAIAGHYAAFNSPEMDAWASYERASGKSFPRDKAGGWRFPSQWPPNHGTSNGTAARGNSNGRTVGEAHSGGS